MIPRQFRGPLVFLGALDAAKLVETLAREDVIASSRGPGLRISFHNYNVPEDVQAVLQVLDRHPELVARAEQSPQPERRAPPAAASLRAEAKRASEERARTDESEASPEARSAGVGPQRRN
jgi:hypothetical protein